MSSLVSPRLAGERAFAMLRCDVGALDRYRGVFESRQNVRAPSRVDGRLEDSRAGDLSDG
jgi:hypothetical protein